MNNVTHGVTIIHNGGTSRTHTLTNENSYKKRQPE